MGDVLNLYKLRNDPSFDYVLQQKAELTLGEPHFAAKHEAADIQLKRIDETEYNKLFKFIK